MRGDEEGKCQEEGDEVDGELHFLFGGGGEIWRGIWDWEVRQERWEN